MGIGIDGGRRLPHLGRLWSARATEGVKCTNKMFLLGGTPDKRWMRSATRLCHIENLQDSNRTHNLSKTANIIDLPWGAWYQDSPHSLEFPGEWSCEVLWPRGGPPCGLQEIANSLKSPIDSPALRELASGRRQACIAIDDLARPTRTADILPPVLAELHEGGLPAESVRIVVATGSHGALDNEQLIWKVGHNVASRYKVECHDCRSNLAPTGLKYGEHELEINATFLESDLKIVIGSVLPHSFAGYSGGAKLVLPGMANLSATARSHKFVQLGLRGGADPNSNRFRREAENLARKLGLKFAICVVTGPHRDTIRVVAGDLVTAHRAACETAREVYRTDVERDYDCLILNAYPKDLDLIQAENAFVALKTASRPVVRKGGILVLATAASEGLGRHGLFEPGGVNYARPRRKRHLGERELWLYTPGIPTEDVQKLYWDGYPVYQKQERLVEDLRQRLGKKASVAILPCAPMQQVHNLNQQT